GVGVDPDRVALARGRGEREGGVVRVGDQPEVGDLEPEPRGGLERDRAQRLELVVLTQRLVCRHAPILPQGRHTVLTRVGSGGSGSWLWTGPTMVLHHASCCVCGWR